MKITILNSDASHPINPYLENFCQNLRPLHEANIIRRQSELDYGDMLFLISCNEKVSSHSLKDYHKTFVIHASDLPDGRGWSPLIWQLLDGKTEFTLSMIEAHSQIDTGDIWEKINFTIPKHALWGEINEILCTKEISLMHFAVDNYDNLKTYKQNNFIEPTYFQKRVPSQSQLNLNDTIAFQFDLMRACDPERFPAFFNIYGHKYKITLEKMDE